MSKSPGVVLPRARQTQCSPGLNACSGFRTETVRQGMRRRYNGANKALFPETYDTTCAQHMKMKACTRCIYITYRLHYFVNTSKQIVTLTDKQTSYFCMSMQIEVQVTAHMQKLQHSNKLKVLQGAFTSKMNMDKGSK